MNGNNSTMTCSFSTISTYGSKIYPDLFEIYNGLIFTKFLKFQVLTLYILKNCFLQSQSSSGMAILIFFIGSSNIHSPSCTNNPRLSIYLLSVSTNHLPHNFFNINCVFMLKIQFLYVLWMFIYNNKYQQVWKYENVFTLTIKK